MADRLDFLIDQGADWNVQLVLQNDDRTPLDLTGCHVYLKCRAYQSSRATLIDLSTRTGVMVLDGPLGQLNWAVPGAKTALYVPQGYALPQSGVFPFGVYDLFIEAVDGGLTKYLEGQIFLAPSVTPSP
ncbi:hypothetical protein BKK79_20090 [Cupriavidus sp. USMAA2-4]|uniref:hypothetical protein n=1 Tax=Cupriavidus sp. USMAA2-4 TaxID=876364 RepID=UPI0008A69A43|nr:hypothetical protein [Cupriavidus sp. USMAA2-4]AOY90401.1 hypothetical protein BKK79_00095 [Cupriavidus sp. USMAA2-4]AOY93847.1 hypothetical protein BKK79_20090 [Cupriavidus sp. USMAA2-4]